MSGTLRCDCTIRLMAASRTPSCAKMISVYRALVVARNYRLAVVITVPALGCCWIMARSTERAMVRCAYPRTECASLAWRSQVDC